MSTTPNKGLIEPAYGSYNNSWSTPVNANWSQLDLALGGYSTVSVTGVTTYIVLSLAQYTPPNIILQGTLSASISIYFPAGVGGLWSIDNTTTGAFTIAVYNDSPGGGVNLPQGQRTLVISGGSGVQLASSVSIAFSQISGQISNAQIPQSAVTQYQTNLSIAISQVSGTVPVGQIPSLPTSQITSGVFGNARLPNVGTMPGVTIQADPGTTPTGTYGQLFLYY